MGRLDRCYNVADLRLVAKKRLPRGVFEYIDKGTEDLIALGNNRSAFEDIKLLNKVITDISDVRLDANLFGKPSALSMAIAPTSTAGLTWFEGEFELAKAAAAAQTTMPGRLIRNFRPISMSKSRQRISPGQRSPHKTSMR